MTMLPSTLTHTSTPAQRILDRAEGHVPRALALVSDRSACSLWRIFQPFAELQRQQYPAEWGWNSDERLGYFASRFDVFILPRLSWAGEQRPEGAKWMESVHKAGKIAIYEADDDLFTPWIVPRQHVTVAKDRSLEILEWERLDRLYAMQLCDGVTVSTRRLATVVRQFTDKPVVVVPNALDLRWWKAVQQAAERRVPRTTVGWAGGARPDSDVTAMAEAWGQIAKRFPKVTFVVQGYQAPAITEHVPDERVRRIPWLPLEVYPQGLKNIDIGCCPLQDSPFNRCKCVVGDTLIHTSTGLRPISSLSQSRVVDTITPLNTRVWTTGGLMTATGFYYGGERDTVRITTHAGFQIEGTLDHPIRRADDEWTMLAHLLVGDMVRIEPVHFSTKPVVVRFNPWAVRERQEASIDAQSLPTLRIDENWGKMLGYIVGDGHIGKNMVRVSCDPQDNDVVDDVLNTCRALGLNPTIKPTRPRVKVGRGVQDVTVSSARFNDFLSLLGVWQEKRKHLAVPSAILQSPRPVVRAFLRALFETDGTVSADRSGVSYTSVSERLAREVQLLLTGFGVFSVIRANYNRHYDKHYYTVNLRRAGVDAFAAHVGFIGHRKSARLAEIVAKPHSNRYRDEKWTDVVAKIERGRGEVFDVTVPGPHEFGSAGFVSHNTPIKAMEYAASGAAVVASPTVYKQIIRHGENGYLATNAHEWEESIGRLLESAFHRAEISGRLATEVTEQYSLEQNAWRWPAAWASILEQQRTSAAAA